jgi:hypothetical protein
MFRWVSTLAALVLLCGVGRAIEVSGPVTKVDAQKNTITLTIDGKDHTFDIKKNAKVYTLGRKKMEVTISLKDVAVGSVVTANAEKEGDKSVLTYVKVEPKTKKKKKDK